MVQVGVHCIDTPQLEDCWKKTFHASGMKVHAYIYLEEVKKSKHLKQVKSQCNSENFIF